MTKGLLFAVWTSMCLLLNLEVKSENFDWTDILPYYKELCQVSEFCESVRHNSANNGSQVKNLCCRGCDCGHGCSNESFADDYLGLTDCTQTVEDRYSVVGIKYRIVVTEPKTGCEAIDSSINDTSVDEVEVSCSSTNNFAAPWGNFYPVYSFDKMVNFINKRCAICHGAMNTTAWDVYGFFKSSHLSHLNELKDLNWSDVTVEFYPPNEESQQGENVCYTVISNCISAKRDNFYIPGVLNLTHEQIVHACDEGPVSHYVQTKSEKFKNVFCAVCNDYVTQRDDFVTCGNEEYNINSLIDSGMPTVTNFQRQFAFLLDHTFTEATDTVEEMVSGKSKRMPACLYNISGSTEQVLCHDVVCPMLQFRQENGTCRYLMENMFFSKVYVRVNLTLQVLIEDKWLANMTTLKLNYLFKQFMPWPVYWDIIDILLRRDVYCNRTEFVLAIGCKFFVYLEIEPLMESIKLAISSEWIVNFGQNYSFNQAFHVHGNFERFTYKNGENIEYGKPEWVDKQDNNLPLTNVSSPTWLILVNNTMSFFPDPPSDDMEITKLFFCDQIELKAHEFIWISDVAPVYLQRQGKYLYPSEYYSHTGENGERVISVCLEDTDFEMLFDNNRGTNLKPNIEILIQAMILYSIFLVRGI